MNTLSKLISKNFLKGIIIYSFLSYDITTCADLLV